MSNPHQAYARVAEITASPREIEAQALMKAMSKLQQAQAQWEDSPKHLNDALLFNRKLWSIFLSEALRDNGPHAREMRENIANLGVFVMKQTLDIQLEPKVEKLDPLININRQVAAGLRGQG